MKIINNVVIGGATIEYYDISTVEPEKKKILAAYSVIAKAIVGSAWWIQTPTLFKELSTEISFVGINRNQILANNIEKYTTEEALELEGISSYFSDNNKISEEQFYDLTLPTE